MDLERLVTAIERVNSEFNTGRSSGDGVLVSITRTRLDSSLISKRTHNDIIDIMVIEYTLKLSSKYSIS